MEPRDTFKISFMGGAQAGIIGALTVLSNGDKLIAAASCFSELTHILDGFGIPVYKSIKEKGFIQNLYHSDLFLSVHGREIVSAELIKLPRYGAINIHPYLYKYKGGDPVKRALKDRNFKASVGAHIVENRIDEGKVLVEEFVDVSGADSVEGIYNRLYPCYCRVIVKVLRIVKNGLKK